MHSTCKCNSTRSTRFSFDSIFSLLFFLPSSSNLLVSFCTFTNWKKFFFASFFASMNFTSFALNSHLMYFWDPLFSFLLNPHTKSLVQSSCQCFLIISFGLRKSFLYFLSKKWSFFVVFNTADIFDNWIFVSWMILVFEMNFIYSFCNLFSKTDRKM